MYLISCLNRIETGYTPIEIDVSKGWFCLQIKSYLVRDIRDPSRIYIPHDIDGTFFSSVINGYFAYAVIIDQGGHFITYTRITHDSFWTKLDDIRLSRTRSYEIPKNDSDRACFVLYKCTDESARVPHQLSKSFRLIQAPSEQPFDAPTDMNPGFLSITAYHNLSLNGCFMCVCLQAFQVPTTLINQVAQGIFLLHESTHPKRVIDCILCILKDSVNKRGPYGENQPVNFRTPGRKGEIDYPSSGDYALLRTKLHVIEPTNIPLDEEGDMIVTLVSLSLFLMYHLILFYR